MEKIIDEFVKYKWNYTDFLTEDDLRCKLYMHLEKNKGNLGIPFPGYSLHSEIRWYGNVSNRQRKLKYRSDLVFINQSELSLIPNGTVLPSKGYAFNDYKAIIELKLRRPNGDSNKGLISKIKDDIDRIQDIQLNLSGDNMSRNYYIIIFDKKNDIKTEIEDLNNSNNSFKVLYRYLENENN